MKKYLIGFGVFIIAFIILLISIFDSSSINYNLSNGTSETLREEGKNQINYNLPYTGNILPDSPFWVLKAFRDRIWFNLTTSPLRKAELALLFADKRILMAKKLLEKGDSNTAMSTFTKGEKYLIIALEEEEEARKGGDDTSLFLKKLATASLKHREIIEDLIQLAPEDVKPLLVKSEIYSKNVFELTRNALYSCNLPIPENPFDRE